MGKKKEEGRKKSRVEKKKQNMATNRRSGKSKN